MTSRYLDLAGAQRLLTPDYQLTRHVLLTLPDPYGLAVIHGLAGLGKTFAVDDTLEQLPVETIALEFPPRITPKQLTSSLLEAACGATPSGTHTQLQRDLADALAGRQLVMKIDEAQRLEQHCIETLRYLFDRPENQLSLVLVGGHRCWELLHRFPALRSRVTGRVQFSALPPEQVRKLIPGLHPIYATADASVIDEIDTYYARGQLRAWTIFTKQAIELMARAGSDTLTTEIASVFLDLQRGLADAA